MCTPPFIDELCSSLGNAAGHDFSRGNLDYYFMITIDGMEMGRRMILLVKVNGDAVESGDAGHG